MPDRYGETTDPDTTPADGYQGGIVCHHEDFRPAARRGIAAVREAMGWSQ